MRISKLKECTKNIDGSFVDFVGLIFNFLGSIFLAFSIVEYHGGYVGEIGKPLYYDAVVDHAKFIFGIFIIIFGFFLQIISRLMSSSKKPYYWTLSIFSILIIGFIFGYFFISGNKI